MILDAGRCTIFRRVDISEPGGKPIWGYQRIFQSWYGELSYESSPAKPTEGRKQQQISTRIRVMECRAIAEHDVCVLELIDDFEDRSEGALVYEISRVGGYPDDDSPQRITDLSLVVMT